MKLIDYIKDNFDGNQSRFARRQGCAPCQITLWLANEYIIVDGKMYSPRREIIAAPVWGEVEKV